MIQIIGAGAIGCLWAATLQKSGHSCHLVSRHKQLTNTLHFTDLSANTTQFTISHGHHLLTTRLVEQQSTILVCVKAPQVLDALLAQQSYINKQQIIILMHNGYGCAEQVVKYFPNNPIISATTSNGSLLNAPLSITHTGAGPTYLGYFNDSSQQIPTQLVKTLQDAMDDVHWSKDINSKCWLKLIINAAINPLSAIKQIKNGQLRSSTYTKTIENIISESIAVAKAESIHFHIPTVQQTVNKVITATAENYSSMNRDIHYQRPTEIEFINGYLIKKALQHQIAAPTLSDLYHQIKKKECH